MRTNTISVCQMMAHKKCAAKTAVSCKWTHRESMPANVASDHNVSSVRDKVNTDNTLFILLVSTQPYISELQYSTVFLGNGPKF